MASDTVAGTASLPAGVTTWTALTAGLTGYHCLWQDLDGVHLQGPPDRPPPTSILWAWPTADRQGPLIRCRLDGNTAYVALLDPARARTVEPLAAWDASDQRVRHVRWAGECRTGPSYPLERLTESSAATGGQTPLAFFRPTAGPHA